MRTKPIHEHEAEEPPVAALAPSTAAPRVGGYRVSADLELRSKELEQALIELRALYREADLARWRARKDVREYKALLAATMAASSAGLGAAITSLVALTLYLFDVVTTPSFLLALVASGSLLRVILDVRKAGIDDNFPPAPGPRLMSPPR